MKKIVIDIGTHKSEELNILLNIRFERIKFYFKWWFFFIYFLIKKIFFWSSRNFSNYGYKSMPTSVSYNNHKKILFSPSINFNKQKLEIICFEPNYSIATKFINKIAKNFKIIFYPFILEKNITQPLSLRNYFFYSNSLSNSIFKKKRKFIDQKKLLCIDIKFFLKKIFLDNKSTRKYKVLLRINCEGSEYNIIKEFISNNINLSYIMGSINDIKKIHGNKKFKEITNLINKKKIKFLYFKGSDPSTWNNAIDIFQKFLK